MKEFGKSRLVQLLSTSTFRQSTITFSGVAINGILGVLFYILSIRSLGPENYAFMAVSIAVLTLVADIGDLGTNTGIVKFVGKYLKKDVQKAFRFLKLSLEIKIAVGIGIAVIGNVMAPFIAESIFKKPELVTSLRYAFVGALFFLTFSFITSALQAFQKFKTWSGLQIFTNLLRVIVLFVLILGGVVTLEANLTLYIVIPFIGFLIGMLFFIPKKFLLVQEEWSVSRQFYSFNKWVAVVTLIAAISSRLDTLITARLLSTDQIGIYAAANQLASIVPQIVGAFGVVLAPKMASMVSKDQLTLYLKKVFLMLSGVALVGLVGGFLVSLYIPLLFGASFSASAPIFLILLVAMLIFLLAIPFHTAVFYYFANPRLFFGVGLVNLLITSIAGWLLISQFGVTGAAITVLLSQISNFLIPTIWVYRNL